MVAATRWASLTISVTAYFNSRDFHLQPFLKFTETGVEEETSTMQQLAKLMKC